MQKIILDIDTGIDDALAIAYLLSRQDVQVVGLTTTFGNVTNEMAYHNTRNIVKLLHRKDVPVYPGASHPMNENHFEMREKSKKVHGNNGIGNVQLENSDAALIDTQACDFMIESCLKYGKDLTIIQVGAMNNLVLALQKNKEAIEKVGRVVIMGGALTVPGNCSPLVEANFRADPDAAHILMESGLPITMVGLDVTHQTVIEQKDIECWESLNSPAAKALVQMCQYYYTNEGDSVHKMVGCLHDPLAVEIAMNPEVVTEYYDCDLTVETEGITRGRSIGNRHLIIEGKRTTRVPLRVKSKEFVGKFVDSIYQMLLPLEG